MRQSLLLGAGVFTLTLAFGCSPAPDSSSDPDLDRATASRQAADWQATLVPLTHQAWRQELASMKGQIVVVDMWATWCIPCIERFPHMVELAHTYSDRGVAFVSLCLDDRDDDEAVALAQRFLTEQGAFFANYLMDEVVTQAFEKLDLLGIPAVFIYGPDGELRYRLTGDDPDDQFTDEDVDRAIEELLAAAQE